MEQPLISCIVPVYNGERFLAEAIDSILAQTYRSTEIIVVDDGSTDSTSKITRQYASRVTCARQVNAGATVARNRGIGLARGEFIAFLDADDLWYEDKLRRQLHRFKENRELGYCITHMKNFWVEELRDEAERLNKHKLSEIQPGAASTFFARRSAFDQVGLLNVELRNRDIQEWMLRADKKGLIREVLPDVLVSRRIHTANISRHRPKEEFFDIIKQALDRRSKSEN